MENIQNQIIELFMDAHTIALLLMNMLWVCYFAWIGWRKKTLAAEVQKTDRLE